MLDTYNSGENPATFGAAVGRESRRDGRMASAKRVLLVDDDAMLRASLAEQLAADGEYAPVEATTVAEARERAKEGLYEFMILDVGLPDGDGRALCRELRQQGVTCPIVLLTQKTATPIRSKGCSRAPTITSPSPSASLC